LVFHEIGCGYVHFLNIVQPANQIMIGRVKVDKPLESCIMESTKDMQQAGQGKGLDNTSHRVIVMASE